MSFNFGSNNSLKLGGATTPASGTATGSNFSFGGGLNTSTTTSGTSGLGNLGSTTGTGAKPGLSFGSLTTPSTTTGATSLGAAPASTTSGFSLGGGFGSTTTLTGLGSTTTPATSTGFSLGGSLSSTPAKTETSSLGLGLGGGLGGTANTTLTTLNTTLTSSAPSSTTNPPITFKVLEDYINKWMADLDSQEKDFINQATQLNALDKLMVDNGEKIIDLNNEVTRLSNEQDQLEQELNFVHSQQDDLEKAIKNLEVGIEQMPLIPQQTSDTSRIEMYKLLIEVDNQLKSMSIDLREVIKRLNDTNVNLNDPIVQISKILNAHMDSLNWIEENTGMIQNQVDILSKVFNERLKETDRTRDESFSRYLHIK